MSPHRSLFSPAAGSVTPTYTARKTLSGARPSNSRTVVLVNTCVCCTTLVNVDVAVATNISAFVARPCTRVQQIARETNTSHVKNRRLHQTMSTSCLQHDAAIDKESFSSPYKQRNKRKCWISHGGAEPKRKFEKAPFFFDCGICTFAVVAW